jgi:phosphoribosylformylglycinamidine synthase
MINQIGCKILLEKVPGEKLDVDRILFSESHSRYLLVLDKTNLKKLEDIFKKNKVSFQLIGQFKGEKIQFTKGTKLIIDLRVDKAHKTWFNSLKDLVLHG